MTLTELVVNLTQQRVMQRKREEILIKDITALSDYETAKAAVDIYAAEKHIYSFDGYLYQLEKLQTLLLNGVPAGEALEMVDSCIDIDEIIKFCKRNKY